MGKSIKMKNGLGVNMGSLNADFEKSPEKVLRDLAEIGYRGVEVTMPLPMANKDFVKLSKEINVVPISIHAWPPGGEEQNQKFIDFAKEINCDKIVFGSFHPDKLKSAEDYKVSAEAFNKVGRQSAKAGVQTLYHNHHWEFQKHGGVRGIDVLMANTDPELVSFEIDMCWLTVGGGDPVEFLKKNEKRVKLIHYKDIIINEGYNKKDGFAKDGIIKEDGYSLKDGAFALAEAGTGVVDFKKIYETVNPKYVEWLISEQDNSTIPPMETAKINYNNYVKLGVI